MAEKITLEQALARIQQLEADARAKVTYRAGGEQRCICIAGLRARPISLYAAELVTIGEDMSRWAKYIVDAPSKEEDPENGVAFTDKAGVDHEAEIKERARKLVDMVA